MISGHATVQIAVEAIRLGPMNLLKNHFLLKNFKLC